MKDTDLKVLFLSTYPPRECGIATFTQDIVRELKRLPGVTPKVVAVGLGGEEYDDDVLFGLKQDDRMDYGRVAANINAGGADVLMVEHEYGIFGGPDGEWLLELTAGLSIPYMVTCHTVLPHPGAGQRRVLARLCQNAAGVVVMSRLSARMLAEVYGVLPEKIHMLHHGVPDYAMGSRDGVKAEEGFAGNFVVSTFGLLSPGKGLEHGIEAIARVAREHPEVRYLILGQTHPVVKRRDGEAYRESLIGLARRLGVQNKVRFVDKYLYKPDILHYLTLSDVYLTPYLGREQAVSGTLAYAIGCGRVVVSTPYLYAREMLGGGRGLLAEFSAPGSLAECINYVIENPAAKARMEENTLRLGKTMTWPKVARQYAQLLREGVGLQRVGAAKEAAV